MAPSGPKTKPISIACPTFDPDLNNYEKWRKKANIWSKLCTMPKKKKGLAAFRHWGEELRSRVPHTNKTTGSRNWI